MSECFPVKKTGSHLVPTKCLSKEHLPQNPPKKFSGRFSLKIIRWLDNSCWIFPQFVMGSTPIIFCKSPTFFFANRVWALQLKPLMIEAWVFPLPRQWRRAEDDVDNSLYFMGYLWDTVHGIIWEHEGLYSTWFLIISHNLSWFKANWNSSHGSRICCRSFFQRIILHVDSEALAGVQPLHDRFRIKTSARKRTDSKDRRVWVARGESAP